VTLTFYIMHYLNMHISYLGKSHPAIIIIIII